MAPVYGKRNAKFRHGKANKSSRTYRIWVAMRNRCNNKNNQAYHKYGARGIKVCKEWDNYAIFLYDMGEAPLGLSIDRIDNDKGYFKDNCRWATPKEQGSNTRQNRLIEFQGEVKHLSEWARYFNYDASALVRKLNKYSVNEAFTYLSNRVCSTTSVIAPIGKTINVKI